jgi:hypothetical protein
MAAENVLATQVTIGMLASGFLQFLKTQKWLPFINQNSGKINHAILLITSAAGAVGVNFAWNASAHSLTITGLTFWGIAAALWIWAKQWSVQFLVHRGVFGPVAVNGVAPHPLAVPAAAPTPEVK